MRLDLLGRISPRENKRLLRAALVSSSQGLVDIASECGADTTEGSIDVGG